MVGNKGEGDRPHGNQKDRTKPAEKTQADKVPIRYAQKAEDHKKSLSSLRQQAEPASNGTAKLHSHETAVNKGKGDRPHGNSKDRTKLAEKTQADKAQIGNDQKAGDHKKLVDKRKQEQPAGKNGSPRREGVASNGDKDQANSYRRDRAKPQAEKTGAEKASIGKDQKADDHKKSASNLRQQAHPAGKGTGNPRS
jgi:hypothetical protein